MNPKKHKEKWDADKERNSKSGDRGPRGRHKKRDSKDGRPVHPSNLPKGHRVTDLRVDGDIDLSIFDDLEPDQDLMVTPTGAVDGQVVVAQTNDTGGIEYVAQDAAVIAATTDGDPPPSSPTPTLKGGPGFLLAVWDADPAAVDSVHYEVHMSTTGASFTPDATTLLAESVTGGMFGIKVDADGLALDYFEEDDITPLVYYVRLIAFDADATGTPGALANAASPGVAGSGSMAQVTGDDIVVNSVTAGNILANDAWFNMLQTVLIETNTLIAGDPNDQHVEVDGDGLRLIHSDGTVLVNLPTNGDSAVFRGQLIADDLAVLNSAVFQGTGNLLDDGSILTLGDTQGNPPQAPTVTQYQDSQPLSGFTQTVAFCIGAFYDATNDSIWRLCSRASDGDVYIVEHDYATGAWIRQKNITAGGFGLGFVEIVFGGGIVRIGNEIVVYAAYCSMGGSPDKINVLMSFDEATLTTMSGPHDKSGDIADFNANGLATDGTFAYIIGHEGGGQRSISKFNGSAPFTYQSQLVTTGGLNVTTATDHPVVGAVKEGSNWLIACRNTDTSIGVDYDFIEAFNATTGAYVTDSLFYGASHLQGLMAGIVMDTASTPDRVGIIQRYNAENPSVYWASTLLDGISTANPYWVGFRWDDGSFHTTVSPLASFDFEGGLGADGYWRRAFVTISVPDAPGSMNSQVFILPNATSPTVTNMRRQTASTYISSEGGTSILWKQYDSGGTVLTTNTNTFGAGNSEIVATASGMTAPWSLKGDGIMDLSRATPTERDLLTPEQGQVLFMEDSHTPVFYDGNANWWPMGFPGLPYGTFVFDDFLYTSGLNQENRGIWTLSQSSPGGTVPTWTQDGTLTGHIGVYTLACGNGTTAEVRIGTGDLWHIGDGRVRFGFLVNSNATRPTTANNYKIGLGLCDSSGSDPLGAAVNQVEITYDRIDDATSRWRGRVNNGGTAVTRDLNANYTPNTWTLLECEINDDGTSIQFYVDGVATGTAVTTVIPTSATLILRACVVKTAGTAGRDISIDYAYLVKAQTTRRY